MSKNLTTKRKIINKRKIIPILNNYFPKITYSIDSYQNEDYNNNMEDLTYSNIDYLNGCHKSLFILCDGHGGEKSAKISIENFPIILSKNLEENKKEVEYYIKKSFQNLDKITKEENCNNEGNTLTSIYIDFKTLYCSNVGDSKSIIIKNEKYINLTYEDKCIDLKEKKRIEKNGGCVYNDRLDGIITLSRSIGDHKLKGNGLISIPHIKKYDLSFSDKYCIIASDGVWDVLSEDVIFNFANQCKNYNELGKKIVDESINLGSQDNISCIVIQFNWEL